MSARLQPQRQRRAMRVRDLDAVLEIETRAYSYPWTRGNFLDSLAAGYAAELLDDPVLGPLGYFVAAPGVDELHLLNLTVAPQHQGQGHGNELLDALQALAVRSRLASIWLEVRLSNERARALYRRRGFTEVGRRRAYYPAPGHREDAVVMSLVLPPGEAIGLD